MDNTPAPAIATDEVFDLTLEAGRSAKNYWHEIWKYRELFYILANRDITIRYKQTAIGVIWAVIQPVTNMIIMTLLFGKVAGLHADGKEPYALMVFAGMIPWAFFSSAMGAASNSMVSNANLISKVYFPRLIVPASSVVTALADLLIQVLILAAMMAWFRVPPPVRIVAAPLIVLLAGFVVLGPGLLLTALNAKYRDFRFVIPFLLQIGLYATPVAYSSTVIERKAGPIGTFFYDLNPMVGVIDNFRWAVLGGDVPFKGQSLLESLAVTIVMLLVGVWYFRKTEHTMADIL